ncbi:MAG: Adenylate cyclase [Candidatus Ozemobacter sibiricus]|uniref:Adenylate cyclase n=1 Tax=Candidatus Ozemobacter sibiricus TaxID=2268124 RepID=A0A367ZLL7_9BACT|nr:MAG: Adenylate cyclase [Candidatus Ozemobacter sibiricus]
MATAPPTIDLARPSWTWIILVGLVVFVLPPLALVGLGRRLVEEEEIRRTAALEQTLLADLRRHLVGLSPERALEQAADRTVRRLGWGARFRGRPLIPPQDSPEFSHLPAVLARVRGALAREIPATPLAVWVVGGDALTSASWGNPRFFRGPSPFPATAVRQLAALWFKVFERRIWSDHDRARDLRRRVATPAGWQAFREQGRKMGSHLFGEYLPLDIDQNMATGFFSARFGLGRIWLIARGRYGGAGNDAPFLGGFVAFYRQADLPRTFLLKGIRRARHAVIFTARRNGVPRLVHTSRRVWAVAPMPPSWQPPLRPGAHAYAHDSPVRLLGVWRWREAAASPHRTSLARGEALLALWAVVGSLWLMAMARGHLALPLSIRGQLALAMAVAVVPPALACGLVARAVLTLWALDGERDTREGLRQELQLLESGLTGHGIELRQQLWLAKEALARVLPQADEAVVDHHLRRMLEAGLAQNLHLFRHDGREWFTQGPASGSSPQLVETLDKMSSFARLLAARLFMAYNPRSWERDRDAARSRRPDERRGRLWEQDQLSIGRAMWTEEELGAYLGRDPIFLDARATGFSQGLVMAFLLWKPNAPVGERLGGVLFASIPLSALGQRYFLTRLTAGVANRLPGPDGRHRLAIFPCEREGQEGRFRLRLTPCWPPDARNAPDLIRIARQAAANPWSPLPRQADGAVAAARVFHAFPFMAVALATPPVTLLERAAGLLVAGGIALLVLLIGLVSRFLERVFLVPMESLVQASQAVATGEYAPALDLPEVAEFAQIGGEFRQMCKGLREGRLLTRFVSSEAVRNARATGGTAFEPGGERRRVAILFSHIHGFTEAARALEGRQVFTWLSQYLSAMEAPIRAQGGHIDKYIGDAIMAVFHDEAGAGTEASTAPPARRAWRAACGMRRALRNLNLRRKALGHPPWRTGIGLTAGIVVSGRIGSRHRRLDFTVIGDAVNLAARLEALRERAEAEAIIVDRATLESFAPTARGRPLGTLAIKGKAAPVEVFALSPDEWDPEATMTGSPP